MLGVGTFVLVWAWLRRVLLGRPYPEKSTDALVADPMPRPPIKDHERRDANAKWIFGIIVFLFVFGMTLHGILAGFLSALKHKPPPTDHWRPSIQAGRWSPPPPAMPRLQVSPPLDLQQFRAREEEQLHTYGWVDRRAGVVRMPIERAMELVLQEGLRVRAGTNTQPGGPSTYQLIQQRPEQREREIQGEK